MLVIWAGVMLGVVLFNWIPFFLYAWLSGKKIEEIQWGEPEWLYIIWVLASGIAGIFVLFHIIFITMK